MDPANHCNLCGRAVEVLTRHHLVPRTRHKNKKNKKLFARDEVKKVIWLCQACHENVHAVLTEKELERTFHTIELLAAHPKIAKFTEWIRTRPETAGVSVKTSKGLGK